MPYVCCLSQADGPAKRPPRLRLRVRPPRGRPWDGLPLPPRRWSEAQREPGTPWARRPVRAEGLAARRPRPGHPAVPPCAGRAPRARLRLHLELWENAGVGVGGELERGVPEKDLNGLHVDAGRQGQRRSAVAQVVKPDRRQAQLLDQPVEDLGEVLRVVRAAVLPGEDATGVDVRPVLLQLLAVLLLPLRAFGLAQREWLAHLADSGFEVAVWRPRDLPTVLQVMGPARQRAVLPPNFRRPAS